MQITDRIKNCNGCGACIVGCREYCMKMEKDADGRMKPVIDENGQVKRVKNRGQKEQFLIEEHHEPLVSKELYKVVQELLDHVTLGAHRTKFSEEEDEIMARAMEIAAREETLWAN